MITDPIRRTSPGERRVVLVTNGSQRRIGQLVRGLRASQNTVPHVVYDSDEVGRGWSPNINAALTDGTVDGVVLSPCHIDSLEKRPLLSTSASIWARQAEAPIVAAAAALQELRPLLRTPDASVVVVLPSLSLAGRANAVPVSTATEAHRILTQSLARDWLSVGISVHTVLLAARWFTEVPSTPDSSDDASLRAVDWLIETSGVALTVNLDSEVPCP